MPGRAAVAMWWDIAPGVRAEWEDWHTHEHMPERLAIPGFLRGSRWSSGRGSYFVLYETRSLQTLTRGAYLQRLNHPTPWSRKMMPHHRNMVRSLCRVRATHGQGIGQVLATIRISGRAPRLDHLPSRKGLCAARYLQSLPAAEIPRTAEQKLRSGDATADGVVLIFGYEIGAVEAAAKRIKGTVGLYRLACCLP